MPGASQSKGVEMKRFALGAIGVVVAAGVTVAALAAEHRQGYLTPGEFDVTTVLEPAPRPGDPRYETDRAIFRATRTLKGTPRWQMGPTTRKPASNTCSRIIAARSACS